MIAIGCISILRHLHQIEPKLSSDVSLGVIGVSYVIAVFLFKLRKLQGDNAVDSWMSAVIGGVMGERTQCKSVLIQVGSVVQQGFHKVAAADVMDKIAEVLATEWIVAHVLH